MFIYADEGGGMLQSRALIRTALRMLKPHSLATAQIDAMCGASAPTPAQHMLDGRNMDRFADSAFTCCCWQLWRAGHDQTTSAFVFGVLFRRSVGRPGFDVETSSDLVDLLC
jgi:hypothetical protein